MIFRQPHLLTKLEIWSPRYSSKYNKEGEWVALLAKYKVQQASPWILIEFSRAPHLKGLRFCIKRSEAETYPIETNGRIEVYAIPMSELEQWDTAEEVKAVALSLFP